MNWRYVPYAGFLLFTILVAAVRFIIMPQFSITVHALWFLGQYCLLVCIWLVIRTIARFLDKRLPYYEKFSRRVFMQI